MDIRQAIEEARIDALDSLPMELTTEEFLTEILKGLTKGQWTTIKALQKLAKKHLTTGHSYVHISSKLAKLVKSQDVNRKKAGGHVYFQWRDSNGPPG